MIRVIVCGGRCYGEVPQGTPLEDLDRAKALADRQRAHFTATMDRIHAERSIVHVAEGKANGADWLAYDWRCRNHIPGRRYQAEWARLGRAAGPDRNMRMLREELSEPPFYPEAKLVVIAFPGNAGTLDMVRRARAAGVEVIEVADV